MKKASDGGANEIKEHSVYDITIENKTFKELTNLDLKYVIFFKQKKLGVKTAATPATAERKLQHRFPQAAREEIIQHQSGRAKQGEPCRQLDLFFRSKAKRAGHTRWPGGADVSRRTAVRRVGEFFNFAEREGGVGAALCAAVTVIGEWSCQRGTAS